MPIVRDPERSVLNVREHRKREQSVFAGQHDTNGNTPYGAMPLPGRLLYAIPPSHAMVSPQI
jgi:hypothetical protein